MKPRSKRFVSPQVSSCCCGPDCGGCGCCGIGAITISQIIHLLVFFHKCKVGLFKSQHYILKLEKYKFTFMKLASKRSQVYIFKIKVYSLDAASGNCGLARVDGRRCVTGSGVPRPRPRPGIFGVVGIPDGPATQDGPAMLDLQATAALKFVGVNPENTLGGSCCFDVIVLAMTMSVRCQH